MSKEVIYYIRLFKIEYRLISELLNEEYIYYVERSNNNKYEKVYDIELKKDIFNNYTDGEKLFRKRVKNLIGI